MTEEATEELLQYVVEFLQYQGTSYLKTLQVLQAEREARNYTFTGARKSFTPEEKEQYFLKMVRAFDEGDTAAFFDLWNDYVPPALLGYDLESQKREFYLHVYFAIYPLLPRVAGQMLPSAPGALATSMAGFKEYLENRGQTLARSGEFLAFYALPYIPQPHLHPSFEDLFSLDWVTMQRMTLEKYLQSLPSEQPVPKLYTFWEAYKAGLDAAGVRAIQPVVRHPLGTQSSLPPVEELDDGETETELEMRTLEDGSGVIEIASSAKAPDVEGPTRLAVGLLDVENTSMLALSTGQGSRSDVSVDAAVTEHPSSMSMMKEPQRPESPLKSQRSHSMFTQAVLPALDYDRLKADLLSSDTDLVARLLQALRWRLQKSPSGPDRQRVLATFIESDLLHGQNPSSRGSVPQVCGQPDKPEVAVELCRLVNSFTCHRAGRAYLLLPGTHAIDVLYRLLTTQPAAALQQSMRAGDKTKESVVQQQALACLQKLSLHKSVQSSLIPLGCLQWLVTWLQDFNRLSDYTIEYGLALLMNLCLRPEGREAAIRTDSLALLENFVESDNVRVRTYVNGALYSLLQKPQLRSQAQQRGLEDLLRAVAQTSTETFAKQIKYILTVLHSAETGEGGMAGGAGGTSVDSSMSGGKGLDDDEGEGEELEEEHEVEVAVGESKAGPLAGERLLCGNYLASVEAAQSEITMLRSSIVLKDLHQPVDSFWGRTSLNSFRRQGPRLGPLAEVPLQRPTTPTLGRHPHTDPLLDHHDTFRRKHNKVGLRASADVVAQRQGQLRAMSPGGK